MSCRIAAASMLDVSDDQILDVSEKQQQQVEEEETVDDIAVMHAMWRHAAVMRLSARRTALDSVQTPAYLQAYKDTAAAIENTSRKRLARLIEHAKRRMLEAIVPLKLRRSAELSSPLIMMLPAGSRVHVVESRRMPDGGERAHVIIAAVDTDGARVDAQLDRLLSLSKPAGWVTARRARLGESLLREVAGDGSAAQTSLQSQRATYRAWPPTFRDLQASGRGQMPLRRPGPGWPYVFFSSAMVEDTTSAWPIDGSIPVPKRAPDAPRVLPNKSAAGQRGGGGGGSRRLKVRHAEARAPSAAQASAHEISDAGSADQQLDGSQPGSLKQALKQVLKAYSVPGSKLSVKSSHSAVEAAADEILNLYANPKSNLLGCRVAELQATFAGEHARSVQYGPGDRFAHRARRIPLIPTHDYGARAARSTQLHTLF